MPAYRRAERVASQVRSAIVAVLREGLRDPRVHDLTITDVSLSDDLRHAWFRFVPLGGQGDTDELLEGLEAASGYLRRELGRRVRLKYLPELHFAVDEGLDAAMHVTALLDQLQSQRAAGRAEE